MIVPGEYTVDEVKEWVRDNDPDGDDLRALYRDERDGKDRVTLTDWLESRADGDPLWDPAAEQVDTDEPADPADASPDRVGPPRETDAPTLGDDDYDPTEHRAWAPGEVPRPADVPLVAVAPADAAGMIAGYYFETRREVKAVRRNRRVDNAIADGDLRYLHDAPDREDGETL